MSRREAMPLFALGLILAISAAWWALALWPLPADAPQWLERTRAVCFGATHDTLPTAAGWSLLIGEPLAMLAALVVIWPDALRDGLRALWHSEAGRTLTVATAFLLIVGLTSAAARVATASDGERFDPSAPEAHRLDRPAPPLDLVNQRGDTVTLALLRGRPVIVAFAYAHCTTVCPLVVNEVRDAQKQLQAEGRGPAVVFVTLDPWRDTPARLGPLATQWKLGAGAHLLSGDTTAVERVLVAWNVPHARDAATGEITHGAPVYLLDSRGTLAWQTSGWASAIVPLARDLR